MPKHPAKKRATTHTTTPNSPISAYRVARYGWRPDPLDPRDRYALVPVQRNLPKAVDLRVTGFLPAPYDQGPLGSCTANALAGAHEYDQRQQGEPAPFTPARLAIYYAERAIEGTIQSDAGAVIRDGMKVLAKEGVAPESLWPYDVRRFTAKPSAGYYAEATRHRCLSYERVAKTLGAIKTVLAAWQRPIVMGFAVPASFESDEVAATGTALLPASGEAIIGGHAVLVVGYDDQAKRLLCRNSWGPDWGDGGYFTLPYGYVTEPALSSDWWTVQTVAA